MSCLSSYLDGLCSVPPYSVTTAAETGGWRTAALIGMKQHLLRFASLLVGHIQRIDDRLRIRLGGECPATLRPDVVGHVTAPNMMGALNGELAVQPVRNIWPLTRSLLICVRAPSPTRASTDAGEKCFALRGSALAFFLELFYPATKRLFNQPQRAGCFDMAVALSENQVGGFLFESGRKRTTLLGHQTPLYGEHSRPKWVYGISMSARWSVGR